MNNTLGSGYSIHDGYGFINAETAVTGSTAIPGAVTLNSVVSRMTHGGAGTFDIPIAQVECRDGGVNGNYTLVFTFSNPITSAGGAIVANGSATVSSKSVVGNTVVVGLTNVINAQNVTVDVLDVHDSAGNVSAAMSATLRVLIGDTSGNGNVNATDVSQIKLQSGESRRSR